MKKTVNLKGAKQKFWVLTFAFLLTGTNQTVAAAEDGTFAVRGIGARQCAEIVSLLTGPERNNTALQLSSWAAGYLSHANRSTPGVYDVMPIQDMLDVATLVARMCENNPDALVEPVMERFVALLSSGQQSDASELTTISAGERDIQIRQSAMAAIQRNLISRNLLEAGNDDGLFGPMTRAALTQFQAANDLPETGVPDALTVYAIFVER